MMARSWKNNVELTPSKPFGTLFDITCFRLYMLIAGFSDPPPPLQNGTKLQCKYEVLNYFAM